MHLILGSLLAGAVAGGSARKLAWRPVAKGLIKQGIRLQRSVMDLTAEVRAETDRLVTDARAELDREPGEPTVEASS